MGVVLCVIHTSKQQNKLFVSYTILSENLFSFSRLTARPHLHPPAPIRRQISAQIHFYLYSFLKSHSFTKKQAVSDSDESVLLINSLFPSTPNLFP